MTTMRLKEIEGIHKKLEPFQDLPTLLIGDFTTRSHLDEKGGWKVTRFLAKQAPIISQANNEIRLVRSWVT